MKTPERKEVRNFLPYVAGKPVEEVKRALGLKKVYKLASNENPEGPSGKVISAIKAALKDLNRYPDGESFYLKNEIAKKNRVSPSNILAGSGTDEIIELIAKTYLNPQDEIVVSRHAFIRYRMAGELMGSKVKTANMREYRHDLKAMLAAVTRRTKVVFIANPNNPTGTYVDAREVGHYMKSVPAGVMTVFDEAYREYVEEADFPSTVDYVKRGRNVIVLRTFSKIHSLAGLRVGYCIAPEPIIKSMNRIRPPFNVNTLAQAAAAACLKEAGRLKRCRGLVHGEKKRLERELDRLGVEYVPSVTNFMLIKCGNGGEMFKKLLSDGIIVRAMDEYELPGWIRVTVGKKNENDAFLRSFKKNLNEKS